MRHILIFMHYETQSRKRVMDLFLSSPSSSFSLHDIMRELDGTAKSSIYRIVDSLEGEGYIRRVGVTEKRSILYQLSDKELCPHHMHIRCTGCGKTEHISEEASREIAGIIEDRTGFTDCYSTVFKGLCSECRRKK